MKRAETQAIIDACLAELERATPGQRSRWQKNFREQFGGDLQACLTEVYKELLLEPGFDELRAEVADFLLKIAQYPDRAH